MNDIKETPNRRRVRRCAQPIDIRNGNDRVVLCIHGFTGYPGEMAYPASRLADAGWDVRAPRLTGHGTDGTDFSGKGFRDWQRQLADEWLDLDSKYGDVRVLGHSMGGLLALDLTRHYPVRSAALMAPAIGIRFPGMFFIRPLSLILKKRPFAWKSDPEYVFFDVRDDGDEEYLGAEYWSWIWLRQLSGLLRLQKQTEKHLRDIRTPILGIFAENDTVVGDRGAVILKKGLGGEFRDIHLKDCRHYIPYDPNPGSKESAMDAVLEWFSA